MHTEIILNALRNDKEKTLKIIFGDDKNNLLLCESLRLFIDSRQDWFKNYTYKELYTLLEKVTIK